MIHSLILFLINQEKDSVAGFLFKQHHSVKLGADKKTVPFQKASVLNIIVEPFHDVWG